MGLCHMSLSSCMGGYTLPQRMRCVSSNGISEAHLPVQGPIDGHNVSL